MKIRKIIKNFLLIPFRLTHSIDLIYERLLSGVISKGSVLFLREEYNKSIADRKRSVRHTTGKRKLFEAVFYTPNKMCMKRAESFSTKEPEMLSWIDDFGGDGAFFDVGANIGLYSVYYAKTQEGQVYAFEPSVFNTAVLAKNISANSLEDHISIVTPPLSDNNGLSRFKYSSVAEGGASNAFGVGYGFDGEDLDSIIEFNVLGFSMDHLVKNKILREVPSMIKIDVDGIEHVILSGAKETLKNPICRSVFVEVNDQFGLQSTTVTRILEECGFGLRGKFSKGLEVVQSDRNKTANQVWVKD